MAKPGRPGTGKGRKKGPLTGTGGHGRRALEGKGPTPKAEDRSWHPAGQRKAAEARLDAARARYGKTTGAAAARRRPRPAGADELVTGRNSVLEALRARVPGSTLYVAARIELDDRVRETLSLATKRGIAVLEVMRPELDRLSGPDAVHQGVALAVPAYEYAHPLDLLERAADADTPPLVIALDGVTDPRNLGAIIRSAAAFGAHGVVVPQRRSVGLTASAWKSSAGAAARVPVAMASNLTQTLTAYRDQGLFVLGLDGGGETDLPGLALADRPLVVVVGSEGKGLSRLVTETCDQVVSIPIASTTESLNAGVATGIALYEIATRRAAAATD